MYDTGDISKLVTEALEAQTTPIAARSEIGDQFSLPQAELLDQSMTSSPKVPEISTQVDQKLSTGRDFGTQVDAHRDLIKNQDTTPIVVSLPNEFSLPLVLERDTNETVSSDALQTTVHEETLETIDDDGDDPDFCPSEAETDMSQCTVEDDNDWTPNAKSLL